MPKVLIVSSTDLAPVLGKTLLWDRDVERVVASTPAVALDLARAFVPSLVILDAAEPRVASGLARRFRSHAGTRRSSIVAIHALTAPSSDDEEDLRDAGVNLLLSGPVNLPEWNTQLERLLSVPRRLRMRLPVAYRPAGESEASPAEAEALDLSMGGMLLETRAPVALRTLLELRFSLPEVADELAAVGTVVREMKGPPARVGIRFLGFSGDTEEQIRGVLASVPPERTFGRYEPIGLIGEGSMGRVYRAFDPAAQRVVAIKTLKPEHLAAEGAEKELERFRREAQSAARLVHANIVTIFDVGDDYFVMELLEGTTLQALIKKQGPLEPDQAAEILAPVARALDFAHSKGTLHQDVKPANIVITRSGRVKLMDFGLARAASANVTGSGRFFGSPAYMAPEQINGEGSSQQSDVYSLAVAAYEALTGHRPFEGVRVSHVLQGAISLAPPPPSAWNPVLPPECDLVFKRALAKDPGLRFPTATAFVAALFPSAALTDRESSSSVAAQSLRVESSDPEAETIDLRDDRPLERLSQGQPDE